MATVTIESRRVGAPAGTATLSRFALEAGGAFLLSTVIVLLAATASGTNPFALGSYQRWDSGIYLSIANDGYNLFPCLPPYPPDQWCGVAGWMPGYPLAIRLLSLLLGIRYHASAVLLASVFHYLSLVMLRALVWRISPSCSAFWPLLLAAMFPGSVYYQAMFPISMMLFFALVSLWLIAGGHLLVGALAAATAAFTYSTGFLMMGVVFAGVAICDDRPWRSRLATAAGYATIAALGLFVVFAIHYFVVGRWNAFFLVQAKYGHGLHFPLDTLLSRLASLTGPDFGQPEKFALDVQSVAMHAIVPAVLCMLLRRIRQAHPVEVLAAIYLALFASFAVLMGPGLSLVRAEATLLPLVVLSRQLPDKANALLLCIFAALKFEIAVAFFKAVAI